MQEITVSTFSIQLGQIRLQSSIGSTKTIYPELFPASLEAQLQGNHRQHLLFQSNWVKYDYSTIVHRIEKTVAWPLEKRDTALDRSWRKLRLILRRGRPISNIFGAKAHANVLKDTFSTNCKSNCMRIGLKMLGFSDTSVPPKHWWCR